MSKLDNIIILGCILVFIRLGATGAPKATATVLKAFSLNCLSTFYNISYFSESCVFTNSFTEFTFLLFPLHMHIYIECSHPHTYGTLPHDTVE